MNMAGPLMLRLVFHGFVVLVGTLILAGAVNTAIVGSNGVLNRVSEDGVLSDWFRRPHPRFGTSYRIIDMVVGLQILTILLSRGDVYLLGEAYAFGVIWSFVMKGLAVLVLRFKEPGKREYRVPLNFHIAGREIPIGLGLITLVLFGVAMVNLFTKQIATISGVAFTIVLFAVFTISEKVTRSRQGVHQELDQFHLVPGEELTPKAVGVRKDNVLVLVRDYHTLYHLAAALRRVNTARQDVAVLHIRLLQRAASGFSDLVPEQLFSATEQYLVHARACPGGTRGQEHSLVGGRRHRDLGRHSALRTVAAIFDDCCGILRHHAGGRGSAIMPGLPGKNFLTPNPILLWRSILPMGWKKSIYLGPHAPHLTPKEIDLLHNLWLRFSTELAPEEIHHHDIVHFALNELRDEIAQGKEQELVGRLKDHIAQIKSRRITQH